MPQALRQRLETLARQRASLRRDARTAIRLRELQHFQVDRLLRTYADYRASARHRAAVDFFVQRLYGPSEDSWRDTGQRVLDIGRAMGPWERLLPQRALDAVLAAVELESLTLELDLAVIDELAAGLIDITRYAAAYRAADRRSDRERQIDLIVECGTRLDALVAYPWAGRALRLARTPARLTRLSELHEFLESGYEAFAAMGGARELLTSIAQRERRISDNLFSGRTDPFRLELDRAHFMAEPA